MSRLLLLALPGGVLLYAASLLLRCHHQHEIFDRVDGVSVFRCAECYRERPNILAGAQPAYKRTQERGNYPEIPEGSTGIERMAVDEANEDAAIHAELVQIERSERWRGAKARTMARFGGTHAH